MAVARRGRLAAQAAADAAQEAAKAALATAEAAKAALHAAGIAEASAAKTATKATLAAGNALVDLADIDREAAMAEDRVAQARQSYADAVEFASDRSRGKR
jgi:hypothetical protein